MNKPRTRNPSGVVKAKSISLRLLPEERAQADRISNESGHSISALSRKAFLRGLPLIAEELGAALDHHVSGAA